MVLPRLARRLIREEVAVSTAECIRTPHSDVHSDRTRSQDKKRSSSGSIYFFQSNTVGDTKFIKFVLEGRCIPVSVDGDSRDSSDPISPNKTPGVLWVYSPALRVLHQDKRRRRGAPCQTGVRSCPSPFCGRGKVVVLSTNSFRTESSRS